MNKVSEIKRAKAVVARFRKAGIGLHTATVQHYASLGVWAWDLEIKFK
jgi:hypothetical protein